MSNISEVAKLAGVSVATVSRVINNPKIVTKKTRSKVELAIKELSYEPNVLGRNLRTSESKLLLALIPSISNPFYTEIMNGIEDAALELGYNILLCETNSNPIRQVTYFNLIKNKLADGLIAMDPTVDKDDLQTLSKNYPVVKCSEHDQGGTISYVTINNVTAAYDAVKHLISLGHKKIALISTKGGLQYAVERQRGYEKALKESNLPFDENLIVNTDLLSFDEGQLAMRHLLSKKDRPTAAFAVSDILAIGALKEINEVGLSIPHEIALIGFDKINFSNMTHPTLTTISQPRYDMGVKSVSMLMDKIKGKSVENIILDHELIIREST